MRKFFKIVYILFFMIIILIIGIISYWIFKPSYSAEDFGIRTIRSDTDKDAGYLLKEMVDEDIAQNVESYSRVNGKPEPNIDFRRVPNLKVYFERNHITLTTDLNEIAEWQPGDIVVFGKTHIGIISDKRNSKGIPYLIHNGGQPNREEDILELYNEFEHISGHYRFMKIQ